MSTDPAATSNEQSTVDEPVDRTAASGSAAGERPGETQGQSSSPSEEELRAAYEAEMARISSTDMILQATVSLLNIGGYRLGLSPGVDQPAGEARDLEQVRDAIDGARALLPILERSSPAEIRPLRDALSQLQMAYARAAGAGAGAPAGPAPAQAQASPTSGPGAPAGKQDDVPPSQQRDKPDEPGPAQSSGRLWVPGR